MKKNASSSKIPTREQILDFIRNQDGPVGKREIARAFGLKGNDRIALKSLLRDLKDEGLIARRRRNINESGQLPEIAILEITGIDQDGDIIARPVSQDYQDDVGPIFVESRPGMPAPGRGDCILARLKREPDGHYRAHPIRLLGVGPKRILGLYEETPEGGRLRPTDKKAKSDFRVAKADSKGAQSGDLVYAEIRPVRSQGLPQARVIDKAGRIDAPGAISLIALADYDLPIEFPDAAVALAEAAKVPALANGTDYRALPLVTIDGEDARDFDDAVHARPDETPGNDGGWHLTVAIADVARYVRPDDALDREAFRRGNSVYFPDRVIPMLPEALSNGLCSLKPNEDRACMVAEMRIDCDGRLLEHRFQRGLMRSVARLTYSQVEAARHGQTDATTAPLIHSVIKPLYGAYESLSRARAARGAIDLDLPEPRVRFDDAGRVAAIEKRQRMDSHRLIEEFMITANVAAAETLERLHQPTLYRVHDSPDPLRLEALHDFLEGIGLSFPKSPKPRPMQFVKLLDQAARTPYAQALQEVVLRTQAQAIYSPDNIGHFGLALQRYCHFTSPIRRYSDLIVHRALIASLGLGDDGLPAAAQKKLDEVGAHISVTERRAASAERDTMDRFAAQYLEQYIGQVVPGRIAGVTSFGLFVNFTATGTSALAPLSTLPPDDYAFDAAGQALIGRFHGWRFGLGDGLNVKINEANPLTGGVIVTPEATTDQRMSGDQRTSGRQLGKMRGRDGSKGRRPAAKRPSRHGPARKNRKGGKPARPS